MSQRVVIVQEHLPHYRQKFYEQLHLNLETRGIAMDFVYSPETATNLLPGVLEWAVKRPVRRIGPFAFQNVFGTVKGADIVILQQEVKYPANLLVQCSRLIGGGKVAYWGHGRNMQAASASLLGERVKEVASRFCDWWFAYNDLSAGIVRDLGFPDDRITSVGNAIDTTAIARGAAQVTPDQLQAIRGDLGIRGDNVCVFTGGLYREKRLGFLFEACELVRATVPDLELIVIGKGPDVELVRMMALKHSWIHYVGAKNDQEKVPYWVLSKLLLMPGLVGLVILDSLALGVPMVTTDYPYHSPEISYLENGRNGVIVPHWPDPAEYASRVAELLRDPTALAGLRAGALASASRFSIERMVANFAEGVQKALATPKLSRSRMLRARPRIVRGGMRLGVVIRSLAPYSRDAFDALARVVAPAQLQVLVGQRGTDWINPWDPELIRPRRADHAYVNAHYSSRGMRTVFPSKDLIVALRRFRPSHLIVMEYSPLSVAAAAYAKATGAWLFVATDVGPDFGPPYPRLTALQRTIHRFMNVVCDGIIAMTPSARKRAVALGKKHVLSPHAVSAQVYLPGEVRREIDTPVKIIAAGNFVIRKGYDLLIDALGKVGKSGDWILECFGSGEVVSLVERAEAAGIGGRVSFRGFAGVSDLIAAYQKADIFVHPSRGDTYGVVVHEAAACGLPLVVSQHAGAADVLVEEGRNGYVIDPNDSAMFAAKMADLIDSPAKRVVFGKRSREIAEQWDVDANARRLAKWIQEQFPLKTTN